VAAQAPAIAATAPVETRPADDRELVRLCQNGTAQAAAEAFSELVRRHQRRVFSVVSRVLRRREDAEEVSQQAFLKAYVAIRKFDLRSAFSTWLYKIAVNECFDWLRKKKVRPLVFESELSDEQTARLDVYAARDRAPENPEERAEARELAERLLAVLSPEDREMLLLKEVEGLGVQEIAEVFELNVNTVKVRMFRARATMMDAYRRRLTGARRAGEPGGKR